MKKTYALLMMMLLCGVGFSQSIVTGTLTPYSNGQIAEVNGSTVIGRAPINGQGVLSITVSSTPNHTFNITAPAGSYYQPFSISVVINTNALNDITAQLAGAMPPPLPAIFPALSILTGQVSINGANYLFPGVNTNSGCFFNDGSGNITFVGCSGGGGGAVDSVFGRTGDVTAQSGDYSSFYDVTGAAAAAQAAAISAAETFSANGSNITSGTVAAARVALLNQNTTGTAANLSGTPALPNGTTGTTQTVGDNTTKLATDAFVLANAGGTPSFSSITSGTNTTGLVVGSGGVLSFSGTGFINANELNGVQLSTLSTGLVKLTAGVPATASAGTDYVTPTGSSAGLSQGSSSAFGVVKVDGTTITATAGIISATGSGTAAFSALTGGTNTTAAMVCGTGCSIAVSGSGTNAATSAPVGGISGLGTGIATFLATPTSANFAAAVTGETGTAGGVVFSVSPAFTGTPTAPTATTGTNTTQIATTAFVLANAGGISGLTTGVIPKAASATTIANSLLDDGVTAANTLTYAGTGGISSPNGFSSTGTTQGAYVFGVGTGTITSTLPTNYVGIIGPPTGTPSVFLQLPSTNPAGQVLSFAAPSAVNGVSQAVGTWITPGVTANPLSQFAATTSAQLRGVLSDESGTGVALFAGGNIGAATGTSLLVTGNIDGTAPITITTGTTATLGGTFKSGYTLNQEATAATAVAYTLPTAAAGLQYCIGNSWNGTAATTGVLTLNTSASGQFIIFTDGTLSATGGNVTSAGAAADAVCVVGVDATHWQLYVQRGTWTKH